MPSLTIFTAPKPFTDAHIATIQRNAIQNWQRLGDVQIVLLGDESGMAEVAAEFGVIHLAQTRRNASGTPLVSSMFALARQVSDSPLLMCTNADMLYLPDAVESARCAAAQRSRFLLVGQRWDLDVRAALDLGAGWESRLAERVRKQGSLHLPAGSDYFIFPSDLYLDVPDFAIGRSGWDNWMIYHARQQGWDVIDATRAVTAIHQNHDYSHLPGGQPHYNQPESHENIARAGGSAKLYTILDADWQMQDGRIFKPRLTLLRFLRRMEMLCAPKQNGAQTKTRAGTLRGWLARRFRRLRRRLTGSL